ncbi:NUDIX domain-containing protein [Salicola sp. Rm-C-2C1-2]|uniref:NUDIX domain-containing protein n=1 Tax=Salicola sp. Rm-C-2C1-2 TaxID=3141321 RepID=UPI0032E4A934
MAELDSTFDHDDVTIESDEPLYQGFFQLRGLRFQHRLFGGGWSPSMHREIFWRDNCTCVLPYDPWRDEVVLLEQFRAGALGRDASPWLLEVVAGINEPGDDGETTARREAEEEAGLTLGHVERICDYLVSPGGTNELVHLYGGCVDATGAGGIHGLEHENEDIRVQSLAFEAAMEGLRSGHIWNAPAIMALQWLALNRERLRDEWRGS